MVDDLPIEVVRAVFREAHAATASLERPARVAFVGPGAGFRRRRGAAALRLGRNFGHRRAVALALDDVARQRADYAVFPFESSLEGPLQARSRRSRRPSFPSPAKVELAPNLSLMGASSIAAEIEGPYAARIRSAREPEIHSASPPRRRSSTSVRRLSRARPARTTLRAAIAAGDIGQSSASFRSRPASAIAPIYASGTASSPTRPTYRSGEDTTALVFGVTTNPAHFSMCSSTSPSAASTSNRSRVDRCRPCIPSDRRRKLELPLLRRGVRPRHRSSGGHRPRRGKAPHQASQGSRFVPLVL